MDDPAHDDEARLKFLRDEGLDLLAAFRRISSSAKRRIVMDLARVLADEDGQSERTDQIGRFTD